MGAYVGTVKTDGFEMEYIRFGTGRKACVIIPGMSVKSVIPNAGAIAAEYRIFADEYTVYLFERKNNITTGYTVSDMADDTAEAMKLLGIAVADLIGVSQGGMIAQYIAARSPELVSRLALCSTLARQNKVSKATFTKWKELAEAGDPVPLNHDVFTTVYSPEYREKYASAFAALEKQGTPDELARFAVLSEASLGFDAYSELRKIKCPIIAVGSEYDNVLSPIGTREIAEKTGCRGVILESSHAAYDEEPDYQEMIFDFFTE